MRGKEIRGKGVEGERGKVVREARSRRSVMRGKLQQERHVRRSVTSS